MRALLADDPATAIAPGTTVTETDLEGLYACDEQLLRLNFVATLDGAANGSDGRSGTVNTPADHRGFVAMRRAADVILVGALTARAEGYHAARTPIVVISTGAELPPTMREDGTVLATPRASGAEDGPHVWVSGDEMVDLAEVIERARRTFGPHVLCEGGPTLAAELVAEGLVDELGLSWTPRLVGGVRETHPRILDGADVDLDLTCRHLLEEEGTLLGLWRISARSR